ncbi:MAG: nucleotidyl transferase AbiEii/AbiGii toxin family protein [Actinomycetota bacterium]
MRITEGYLSQHYQGRAGGRDPALLDIAQDHAIALLNDHDVFDLDVVLKGGTALRKFRAGNAGRFSTDLDFAVEDDATAALLLDTLDGGEIDGFSFRLENRDGDRRADLVVDTPFGQPRLPAKIDLSTRGLWLSPAVGELVPLPIHKRYDVTIPSIEIMGFEEQIAEKLARYRRASLARDLYDLAWCAGHSFDQDLVRRVWILKCYFDIVEDGLGHKPVAAGDVLDDRDESSFAAEQIGYLTTPVDVPGWVRSVNSRFAFLADLDADEARWAQVNAGDRWDALQAVEALQ